MPRIPVFNSRVPAPGPIPGIGNDLAAPGRALARLGGAIGGFGEDLARKAARDRAADRARRAQEKTEPDEPQDESVSTPGADDPEVQEELTRQAGESVAAVLDDATDDARFSVMRADALLQASLDSDPGQLTERALAYYDAASRTLIEETGDPALRARRQVLARQNRDVLVKRANQRRNGHTAAILNERLATALGGFANAVRRDPAMLVAMLKKGTDAVVESARRAGLGPEHTEAMTEGWIRQAYTALVEGTIERDPALALASLESGELDGPLGNDAALTGRLRRQAERAMAAAEAAERQRARSQRQLFELQKAGHLESIRKTGRGDPETVTLAGGLLDPQEMAAFRAEIADAEAHNAARTAYAFMTAQEIDADIARKSPGGGPRDGDERARRHTARTTARDEVLAERASDPAAWAMRDETVAEAFAAAEQALELAEPGTPEMEQAERAFRRALALRWRVQIDMGETPRLLTEAEREALAEELQSLAPTGRPARIGELRRRYGDDFNRLASELSGRIAPDTAVLLARADDPALAGALARGVALDGVPFRGARELALPMTGGKLDKSRLEDRQLYNFMAGDRVVRVVYDRKADALVPALAEGGTETNDVTGSPLNAPSQKPGRLHDQADLELDARNTAQVPTMPTLIGEGSVGLPDERPIPGQDPTKILTGRDVVEKVKKGSAFTQAVILTDEDLRRFNQGNRDGVRAFREASEILFRLDDDEEFLSLPGDAAAYAIRNWDIYRSRLALLSKLQDASLSPEELRSLVKEEVYKGIPHHLRDKTRGPDWISMEGGDPENFGQRAAAAKLKSYDDLVAALDAGASQEALEELLENFRQALLPELLGWGPVLADIVKDLVPGLSNLRSGIHAWNDLIEIANDFNDGDLLGLIGNSGMLVLDMLGIIPVVGNAFAPVRIAVKSGGRHVIRAAGRTVAGRIVKRWVARRRLAKYLQTKPELLQSKSIEQYFGKVWADLPPRMQDMLSKRFSFFVGRAGETKTINEFSDAGFDVITEFRRRRFDVAAANTGRKTRVFDVLTEQDFKKIWGDWFVLPHKGDSGLPTGAEIKVNLSKYIKSQEEADEHLVNVAKDISAAEVMRLPADMIKPDHLAAAVEEWLKRPWRTGNFPGGVPRKEVEDLIAALQKPGDLTVGQLFGLTMAYMLGRYATKAVPGESTSGFMSEPSAMS